MLTDDTHITEINATVFARKKSTDVIALRYDPIPGIETRTTAELFINVQRAMQCHHRQGWTPSKELALYIAHGCDHLSGGLDDTETQRKQMRRRELRWLRELQPQALSELKPL